MTRKLLLTTLLLLALGLTAAWSLSDVFSRRGQADWRAVQAQGVTPESAQNLGLKALRLTQKAALLAPANAAALLDSARLAARLRFFLPPDTVRGWGRAYLGAAALAPSWEVPLLELSNWCVVGDLPRLFPQPSQCLDLLDAAIARNPTYGYAIYRRADQLFRMAGSGPLQRPGEAQDICKQYGKALGLMQGKLGWTAWYDQAEQRAYQRCWGLSSSYAVTRGLRPLTYRQWQRFGRLMGLAGDSAWAAGREQLLADLAIRPEPLRHYETLARGLGQGRRCLFGMEVLRNYLTRHPHDPAGWVTLARFVEHFPRDIERGLVRQTVREARSQAHFTPVQSLWLSWVSCRAEDPDQAMALLAQAGAWQSDQSKVYRNIGTCLRRAGHGQLALRVYDKWLAGDPASVDAWLGKGQTLAGMKKYPEAIASIQRALDLDPGSRDARALIKQMGIY